MSFLLQHHVVALVSVVPEAKHGTWLASWFPQVS
jgi:hypothetical protein